MQRIAIPERPDWREKAAEYGFQFHTMYGEPYWCEDAYYQFTLAQVEQLEDTTAELHQMCLQAVEKVVSSDELEGGEKGGRRGGAPPPILHS